MLTEAIFDWAKRTPEKTAVIYNGQQISYGSFAHGIAIARGYFARRGIAGTGYAVLAVRHLMDFWVLSLALRSLGLTTVAVWSAAAMNDLALPNVRCVITTPDEVWPNLAPVCKAQNLELLSVSLNGEPALMLAIGQNPYPSGGHILLTSGTTGTHKMVLMSPEVDSVSLRFVVQIFGISERSVSCGFDFPAWTAAGYRWLASPWIVGATGVIEQTGAPHQAFLRASITHALLVPSMLDAILAAPIRAFPYSDSMKLAVGGGATTLSQVEQAKARITPHVFSLLTSTEAGAIALSILDTPEDHKWHQLLAGRTVEIVDEYDRPTPKGQTGLLRIGTAGGPTKYLHNEAATQAFFRDGFFYPGDLAVMGPDGRLTLKGRVTDVINVKGRKLSPAPIEERLTEMLGVAGVCLFSMQNEHGEEDIYVVIESQAAIESGQLIGALRQELGKFPTAYIHYLSALQRNQAGKVLRRAVRAEAETNRVEFTRVDLHQNSSTPH